MIVQEKRPGQPIHAFEVVQDLWPIPGLEAEIAADHLRYVRLASGDFVQFRDPVFKAHVGDMILVTPIGLYPCNRIAFAMKYEPVGIPDA